jgi:membrane protein YdbS with pleckstrin-like domain
MNLDRSLFSAFKPIKQRDETICWAGRPHFFPYVAQGIPFLIFGGVWVTLWYKVIGESLTSRFALIFSLILLWPFWSSIRNMARLLLRYRKTVYAITDRRILIREGTLSLEYASIDFSRIIEVRVSQNPLEAVLGLGTLWIYVSGTLKGGTNHEAFRGIHDPHEVCRKLTEISVSPIAVV